MKTRNSLLTISMICFALSGWAQNNVAINNTGQPAHPSAMLDVSSFDKGFLMPTMESLMRWSIINPAEGLMVCDTTTKSIWIYSNHQWEELAMKYNMHFMNDFGTIHNVGDLFSDDFVFGSEDLNENGIPGHRNRFFFDKGKAAFRAGALWDPGTSLDEIKYWDSDSLGYGSVALGVNVMAKNTYSVALGGNAIARGYGSVAIGNTVESNGTASVALGITKAIGDRSFSTGSTNQAIGYASSAMGELTNSTGKFSTSTGERTLAKAMASVAIGKFNVGNGDPLNWVLSDPLFEIGNAPDLSSRQNAFTVLKGGTMISGSHQVDDDPGRTTDNKRMYFHRAQGAFRAGGAIDDPVTGFNEDTYFDKIELGDFSAAFGLNSRATGYGAFAVGLGSAAADTGSIALGAAFANGKYATAVGYTSHANGNFAFAAGDSDATGEWSSALGLSNAGGQWSTAGGVSTASAFQSTAMGFSTASSTAASAMGVSTASGSYSAAIGFAKAESFGGIAVGYNNIGGGNPGAFVAGDPIFEVGNGGMGSPSNAFTVLKNGRVAINHHNPQSMLDIDQPNGGPGNGVLLHLPGAGHWETMVTTDSEYNFYYNNNLRAYLTEQGTFHLPEGLDVGLGTDGNLVIGSTSGWNISIDNNEIMARNAGGAHDLLLQKDGGRVGIGTMGPANKLDVNGKITLSQSFNNEMVIINDEVYGHGFGTQSFGSGGSPFLMASKEGVTETAGIYGDGDILTLWSTGDTRLVSFLDEDYFDATNMNPYDNSGERAYIDQDGNYYQVSDERLKNNINRIENAIEKLNKINGYTYKFRRNQKEQTKGQSSSRSAGVVAQEVEKVIPEAVSKSESGQYFVNYDALIPVLIEGMKEQQKMIEELQEKIRRLEKGN